MVLPGILAYVLFSDIIQDPNDTLPVLISKVLPIGLIGLMAAALLAALMSTVAAALNSIGTMVSIDIVKRMKPETTDKSLLRIGRATSIVVMLFAISWSPVIGRFESIFDAIAILMSMLSPPVASVFVMGLIWAKGIDKVVLSTMIFGLLAGTIVFCLDFTPISGYSYITDGLGIGFLMQAWWLFVLCCTFYIVLSLNSVSRSFNEIQHLVFTKENLNGFKMKIRSIKDPRIWTIFLLMIMLALYILFG